MTKYQAHCAAGLLILLFVSCSQTGSQNRNTQVTLQAQGGSGGYQGTGITYDKELSGPSTLTAGVCTRFTFQPDPADYYTGSFNAELNKLVNENVVASVGIFYFDANCEQPIASSPISSEDPAEPGPYSFSGSGQTNFYVKDDSVGSWDIQADSDRHTVTVISGLPRAALSFSGGSNVSSSGAFNIPCNSNSTGTFTQGITVSNGGNAIATLTGITFSASVSGVSVPSGGTCGAQLAPGQSCTFEISITGPGPNQWVRGFLFLEFENAGASEVMPLYLDLARVACAVGA